MKRQFTVEANDGTRIYFEIFNRTPRRNEYERGQIYGLAVMDKRTCSYYPTGYTFHTLKAAKEYAAKNYFIWL